MLIQDKNLVDKLVQVAIKQIDVARTHKKERMLAAARNQDSYNNEKKPALKGRFNIPLPIMSGFIDDLQSKIDDMPEIVFASQKESGYRLFKMVSAMWKRDSGINYGAWGRKDRGAKKMASFAGRAVFMIYAESKPVYRSVLEVIHYNDFLTEPQGGADTEKHLFLGTQNNFKTVAELEQGAKDGIYYSDAVDEYKKNLSEEGQKQIASDLNEKNKRAEEMGLNISSSTYVGQQVAKLVYWCMDFEGTRYYLVIDEEGKKAIRCELLADIAPKNLYPFVSWAVYEDLFTFWSKAPADDIYPVADAQTVLMNQALDNRNKRNYGQRAYDMDVFPDANLLEWRPNGLVPGDTSNGARSLREGIYEFETPEIGSTIELFNYLDGFIGKKTGIHSPNTDKRQAVGVYYGDLQNVADRMGTINKSYTEAWAQLGLRYYYGLKEHLNAKTAVKIMGTDGVEWAEFSKEDLASIDDPEISVIGVSTETKINEAKFKKKMDAVNAILKQPLLMGTVNPTWVIGEVLRGAEYSEDEIRVAKTTGSEEELEALSEAAEENEEMLSTKKPAKPNRSATTGHVQKHVDFITDEEDLSEEVYKAVMTHIQKEMDYVRQNTIRKAIFTNRSAIMNTINSGGGTPGGGGAGGIPPASPSLPAGTEGGTAQASQGNSPQPAEPMLG